MNNSAMRKYAKILELEKYIIRFDPENIIFFYLHEVLNPCGLYLISPLESGSRKDFSYSCRKPKSVKHNILFF